MKFYKKKRGRTNADEHFEKNGDQITFKICFEMAVSAPKAEHQFFAWLAGSIVVLVFVGCARTYYLHSLFGMPALTRFLHFHGAVMTGWIVLFAAQIFLITSNLIPIRRILGAFGAGFAVLVVLMGTITTLVAARREVRAHSDSVSGVPTVLALELTQMALFASLVVFGVWLRNRTG